jgi:hypothetical protein
VRGRNKKALALTKQDSKCTKARGDHGLRGHDIHQYGAGSTLYSAPSADEPYKRELSFLILDTCHHYRISILILLLKSLF